jgi:hypothetical protein
LTDAKHTDPVISEISERQYRHTNCIEIGKRQRFYRFFLSAGGNARTETIEMSYRSALCDAL